MEALAEGSPLWDVEEYEEDEEDASAAGQDDESQPQAWMTADGNVDFDVLFERGVALGVLSEAQLDQMTDQVASGETRRAVVGSSVGSALGVAPRQCMI